MKENTLIKLEHLWKVYQLGKVEITVLKDINLEIQRGDFMTIMGPSGSGKSTLMYLIGCLDTPTKGKVFLENTDVSLLSNNQLASIRGRKIGFVFQQFNLLPNLTALENVTLPMVFQKKPEKERIERAKDLLISVGLGKRINHRPAELSGGERQRVAIARALANDPEIIVADEPTGNLDSTSGKVVMDIFKDLHQKEGRTIVVVTHDPNIAKYSKKIVHIKDGRIIKNHLQEEKILWSPNNL